MSSVLSMLMDTAPLVHRVPGFGGMIKRVNYVARGVTFAGYTREWFDFLQQPELAYIISHHPSLYHKLQRPYLSCTLNTAQRVEALKRHYSFVLDTFSSETIRQVYGTPGLLLASFTLKDLGQFGLRLSCSRQQNEGDLTIGFFKKGHAKDRYTLSFTIWKYKGSAKEIFIGGLEGPHAMNDDLVVDVTHALYGLHPNALLVFALQQLSQCWGVSSVRAASDAARIHRHFQKRKTTPDLYDNFWRECGGKLAPDGMFELPETFVPREISMLDAHNGSTDRHLYEMLSHFADQIPERFQSQIEAQPL